MSCKVRLSRRISLATAMRRESINLFVLVGLTTVACTETHFDVPDRPLWPFPYEDAIKSGFLLATDPTIDPARGFCGGSSLDGTPQTLTKYIWEYPIHGVQTPIFVDAQ